jgi:cobalt-zinc-cadmium efflux system outer membrane protein
MKEETEGIVMPIIHSVPRSGHTVIQLLSCVIGNGHTLTARGVFPALVVLFICGCSTFHSRPLSPSLSASSFEARRLEAPGLRDFIETNFHHKLNLWPPVKWDFEMLTLAALYYHPEMDVARAKWGVAEAGIMKAGGRPNPSAGFSIEHHSATPGGISPWTWGLILDVPVETAGKRGYRIAQAQHLSEAARLDIATAAWKVRSRVRSGLVGLYAARQREILLKRELAVRDNLTRILEQRFSAGMLALSVITDVRIARDKARLALNEAHEQKAEAIARFADSLGVTIRAIEGLDISFDFIDSIPQDFPAGEARREALLNRPDIMAGLAEYAASQSALQLEIAKQYPDIHLGPGYIWDQGDNRWSVGVSLSLPLLNRNQGPIAEARARREESAARFGALQARTINEIDRTIAGYRAALQTYKTAGMLLKEERRKLRILRSRVRPGEASRFTLAKAKLALISAEVSQFEALVRLQRALGAVEDSMQRPVGAQKGILLHRNQTR